MINRHEIKNPKCRTQNACMGTDRRGRIRQTHTANDEYRDCGDTPAKRAKNPSFAEIEKYKTQEGQAILSARLPKEKLWVLEVKGEMLSTERLADRLQTAMTDGTDIALVIGGADGVSADVLTQADFKWSLSDLTLPHPLVRVVLIEQLYRAMSIINNHPYHRA